MDIAMAAVALRMTEVHVTADANGRARGELGSASVMTRDAIANQGANSLAGVLELVPGVPLQPPGLDQVQQIAEARLLTTIKAKRSPLSPSFMMAARTHVIVLAWFVEVFDRSGVDLRKGAPMRAKLKNCIDVTRYHMWAHRT